MYKEEINTIEEYYSTFIGLKQNELKEFCKIHKIKLSIKGVSNKWVLLINIYKYFFGIEPKEHSRDHELLVIAMSNTLSKT